MEEKIVTHYHGIGFCGTLFIVFLTLKLCHVIAWSWIWVSSPIWLPISAVIGIIGIIFIGVVLGACLVGIIALICSWVD